MRSTRPHVVTDLRRAICSGRSSVGASQSNSFVANALVRRPQRRNEAHVKCGSRTPEWAVTSVGSSARDDISSARAAALIAVGIVVAAVAVAYARATAGGSRHAAGPVDSHSAGVALAAVAAASSPARREPPAGRRFCSRLVVRFRW